MASLSDRPSGELRANELAELNELLWALPVTLDPYGTVAVLLDKGARLFHAPLSCVFLKEAGAYELAGVYGFTDKKAEQLWGRLDLANHEPVPLHLTGSELHALSSFGKRRLGALLAMPLVSGGSTLGWVIFARFEPTPFSDIEQHFISVILERVAASLESARRFQETESRSHELALLYEIAQLLVSTVNLDALLERLTRRMVEAFDLSFCAIRLYDPATNTMPFKAYHHRDAEEQARLVAHFLARPLAVGEGRTGQIFTQRAPHVSRNIMDDPYLIPEDRDALGAGSLAAVPLFVRDRVLGVLFWFRAGRQRPLTEAVVPLIGRLGNLVSVAIVNAQLYQELEVQVAERTADLKAAHQSLEARMASDKAVITQATLSLRSQLQNILGYGDLLHHLVGQGPGEVHLQKDYLEKMLTSAEVVNGLVEGLITRLQSGEIG